MDYKELKDAKLVTVTHVPPEVSTLPSFAKSPEKIIIRRARWDEWTGEKLDDYEVEISVKSKRNEKQQLIQRKADIAKLVADIDNQIAEIDSLFAAAGTMEGKEVKLYLKDGE